MVQVKENLTNRTFNKLKVIRQIEDYISPKGKHEARWECQCECGNIVNVIGSKLKTYHTQSCGCLQKERIIQYNKKYNDYEIQDDYVIMYTVKGEPFYIDLEDFNKVKDICWCASNGYLIGNNNGRNIRLHRLIMNCPDNMEVDHINHNTMDNRKSNLRIVTRSQNNMNHGLRNNNNSGITGVCWNKTTKEWMAYIDINSKRIHLGSFNCIDDAIKIRREAEEKYFGEFGYNNSPNVLESL